mmetsp:Transcript_14920/g.43044  ORF Transcript_14920/g.43044 Transcript_14920/m.43044 type:complete len:357 (+) Transcript_14920:170-1240(+)
MGVAHARCSCPAGARSSALPDDSGSEGAFPVGEGALGRSGKALRGARPADSPRGSLPSPSGVAQGACGAPDALAPTRSASACASDGTGRGTEYRSSLGCGRERFKRCGRAVGASVRLGKLLAGPRDVPPAKCAISLEQLNDFDRHARDALGEGYLAATVRDVRSAMVQPMCDVDGRCFARSLNDDKPCVGQVFVCHCWDQNFGEFVDAVNHTFRHWARKPNLWIALFALVQTRRRLPCTRPLDAPFVAALRVANAILVVEGTKVDIYSRLWMLWEMYLAFKLGTTDRKGGFLVAAPPAGVEQSRDGTRMRDIDTRHASATDPDEGLAIRQAIEAEERGYAGVNEAVAQICRRCFRQ